MPKKMFTPEQIMGKLRQIEVLVSQVNCSRSVSVTRSNRRVRTLMRQGLRWDRPRYADQAGLSGERGLPSACILYIEIVPLDGLLSALIRSQPWYF